MLETLKRWWGRGAGSTVSGPLAEIETWAARAGYRYRQADDDLRFVVEVPCAQHMLRMEWGASQRSYIVRDELRIRLDLSLPGSLQLLAITRPLMERLEVETYERYTQEAQTIIDMSFPEEMRWLAMFPKVDLSFDKVLRARFGVLGVNVALATAWINSPLGAQLAKAAAGVLANEPPCVLMVMHGKVYLRMQLAQPQPDGLAQCLGLFDAAVQSALELAGHAPPTDAEYASTASSAWQTASQIDTAKSDPG